MHITYSKDGKDGKIIDIRGFLLPKVPPHPEKCQICGKELTEYEKKHPGEIQWRKDGKLMEVASAYYDAVDTLQYSYKKRKKEREEKK